MRERNVAAVDNLSLSEDELLERVRHRQVVPQVVPSPEAKTAAQQRLLSAVEKKRKELGLDACQLGLPEAA